MPDPIPSNHPQSAANGRLLLTPAGSPITTDHTTRREYDCIIMTPGFVVRADGQESNWLIPAETIRQSAPLFESVASYIDHPEWFAPPQVKNLVGVIFNPRWDDTANALLGSLRLYDEDPNSYGAFVAALFDRMLADQAAGLEVPPVGLSATFWHKAEFDEDTGNRITTEFKKVDSVDIVYTPGAGGYVKQALAAVRADYPQLVPFDLRQSVPEHILPERSTTMPPEDTQEAPPEMTLDEALASIARISERIEALETVPDTPSEESADAPELVQRIDALGADVQTLTDTVAEQQAAHTITGMGDRPRDVVTEGQMTTGLDQLQAAWDWIFGATEATLPPPDLRRTDRLYYLLSGDGGWTGVFDQREALAAANATTLAGMAVNAMNKVIIPLFDRLSAYRWFENIVAVQPTDGTLHDMAWIQFGGIGDLPIVAEGAAYTELTVDDSKEADSFVKYGGYVGITEKMLRNSDIAKIQAVPRSMTLAAIQTRSAKISSIFTQASGVGPTLDQDSVVLFHTVSHGNLATTPYSITAWKAARLECYKQTELHSAKRQGLWPKYWLGPAGLYDTALIDFGYGAGAGGYSGTANNDVNPYAADRPGDPRPIPLAVPDFTDANNWAYIADPNMAPIIQMAYADSPGGLVHPPPMLFMVTSPLAGLMFTNDVLPIKVRDYFAYGVSGYRGIGKRNVA